MKFAKILNQPTVSLFPVETSVVLEEKACFLAGTSFENVKVKFEKKTSTGSMIFTHSGLSGEAIMKLSEHIYKNDKKEIFIDFLPNVEINQFKNLLHAFDEKNEKEIISFLNTFFSKKFSRYLMAKTEIINIISLTNKETDTVFNLIKAFSFKIKNVNNLEKACITGGGIDMKYIDCRTMESKLHKGIYFVGEALDVHGPIGGYNITLALSTGYTAGISIKN